MGTPKSAAPDRPRQPNQYTYAGGAGSSACNGGGGAGPGGSSGSRSKRPVETSPRCASTSGQKRSLPVISSLPAGFGADNGGPITGATVQMVLAEGAEADVDQSVAKQRGFDPDLWVIEVEDKAGRHLLDEPGLD